MITQAFVLGAGLGTRLRPLTDDLPKPLVPIFQKPLISFALDHLIELGVENIHLNTHHLPEQFGRLFPQGRYRDLALRFHHEPLLLETAGGIANIAPELGDAPLLVYNGDILSDLPLRLLVDEHFRNRNLVTLALRSSGGPPHIALSHNSQVTDISNQLGTNQKTRFVFTGIYIVSPDFIRRLQPGAKRSVIPHFLDLIAEQRLGGVIIDEGNWWDVGTPQAYLQLHRQLGDLASFPKFPVPDRYWRSRTHPTARIAPDAVVEGCSVVGDDTVVNEGAKLRDTIVWAGAQIASRSVLTSCIVRTQRTAQGSLHDAII